MNNHRRAFFQFLAASAVLTPAVRALAQMAYDEVPLITKPSEGFQITDFEPAAHKVVPPAHWGYMATGSDDNQTIKANVDGYKHIGLKPRRLVDVSKPDMSTTVFGQKWETPLFICPVGGQRAFHETGEMGTAGAARAKHHQMILSNVSTYSLEDVAKTYGKTPWQQLYMPLKWEDTERMVKRIEDAGCPVLVWTVDLLAGRNTPTMSRGMRIDTRDCFHCHENGPGTPINRPMFDGLEGRYNPAFANWATFDKLKKLTKMKVILKGLDGPEDAQLAVQHGADGIIVSNHGGRSIETLRGTIDCLPDVVAAVKGKIPVFVDGGVRHGADIYKAMALGAAGVGIGRPYIWGLSAFGQPGVERVLDILRAELQLTMQQMGTPTIKDISASRLMRV